MDGVKSETVCMNGKALKEKYRENSLLDVFWRYESGFKLPVIFVVITCVDRVVAFCKGAELRREIHLLKTEINTGSCCASFGSCLWYKFALLTEAVDGV